MDYWINQSMRLSTHRHGRLEVLPAAAARLQLPDSQPGAGTPGAGLGVRGRARVIRAAGWAKFWGIRVKMGGEGWPFFFKLGKTGYGGSSREEGEVRDALAYLPGHFETWFPETGNAQGCPFRFTLGPSKQKVFVPTIMTTCGSHVTVQPHSRAASLRPVKVEGPRHCGSCSGFRCKPR